MQVQNNIIEKIRKIAKQRMRHYGCHSWDHVKRVHDLCVFIGKKEKGDLEILKISSLLHDVARNGGRGNHAVKGAREAEQVLLRLGLQRAKVSEIVNVIKTHRFKTREKPLSLEAKVLSDADKLDAMGAIGVYRASAFGGETSRSFQGTIGHFDEKLLKLKDRMYTATAKKLAKNRHKFMLVYLKQVEKEIGLKS